MLHQHICEVLREAESTRRTSEMFCLPFLFTPRQDLIQERGQQKGALADCPVECALKMMAYLFALSTMFSLDLYCMCVLEHSYY